MSGSNAALDMAQAGVAANVDAAGRLAGMGALLLVAAEAREFDGLLRRVPTRPLGWRLRFARDGELNGKRAIFVANGPGMNLAGAAAEEARRRVRPDAVISVGFCGALDRDLKNGDVLIASSVIDRRNGESYPACEPGHRRPAGSGGVVSVNRVTASSAERQELRSTGARAVEMEAAVLAAQARTWSVPFYCIRSVSDSADEDFAIDFNRMRDASGRFSRSRILCAALARPWSRIPFLLKLDHNCRKASESLGEFLADCSF